VKVTGLISMISQVQVELEVEDKVMVDGDLRVG
jgi:hypothetical protein